MGERRAGKTSLLKLIDHHFANDASRRFVPVLIPWQGIQSRDELEKEILQSICLGLDTELPNRDQLKAKSVHHEATTTSEFIKTLQHLLPPASGKIIIICIDEFDSIIQEADKDERKKILGLATTLVEIADLPMRLLLTMSRLPDLPEARSSPLIAKSEQIPLPPFSPADFDEMIEGLTGHILSRDLQRLYELSGGWPYFAKLLLTCLAELKPDDTWVDRALESACKHAGVEQTLENIYNKHLDENERAVMLLLAKRICLSAEEMVAAGIALKTAAEELIRRNYVWKDEKEGSYCFRIGFLAKWFPQWVKFEEQVANRLGDTLLRLERVRDPWLEDKAVIVTDEELKEYDF